jgi:hypothetical protein
MRPRTPFTIVWRIAQATMLGLAVFFASTAAIPTPTYAIDNNPNPQDDPKPKPQGPWADIKVTKNGPAKRSAPGSHTVIYTFDVKNIGQTAATNVWGRYECVAWDANNRHIISKGQIGNFSLAVGQTKTRTVTCHDASGNYIDQTRTDEAAIFMDAVPEPPQATFNNDVVISTWPAY